MGPSRRKRLFLAVLMVLLLLFSLLLQESQGEEFVGTQAEINAAQLTLAHRNRALLLGFDKFVTQPDTSPASWNNVDRMADVLSRMVDLDMLWTRRDDIDDHAQLMDVIQEAYAGAREGDVNYFYISTHGLYEKNQPATDMGMLLTDGSNDFILTASQLRTMLDQIPGRKILIIDCCHSGAMIGKGVEDAIGNAFTGGDYRVLCSSGGAEDSWFWTGLKEKTTGAGFFTGTLIQGISSEGGYEADGNKDGTITFGEVRHYLLQHHGASTVHLYPEAGEEKLISYDRVLRRHVTASALEQITFEEGILTGTQPVIHFSFTALRPVRLAYQIVYQQKGKWDFANGQVVWDNSEQYGAFGDAMGYITPGYKEREIRLMRQSQDGYGYVLLQIFTYRNNEPVLASSRVFGVSPAGANPQLEVHMNPSYDLSQGEVPIMIGHIYPCEITVTVENMDHHTVRKLTRMQPSRPENLHPMGTTLAWDGLDDQGAPVPEGMYRLKVIAMIDGKSYEKITDDFFLTFSTLING